MTKVNRSGLRFRTISPWTSLRWQVLGRAFPTKSASRALRRLVLRHERGFPFGTEVTDWIRAEIQAQSLDRRQVLAGMWNRSESLHSLVFAADLDELLEDYPGTVDRQSLQGAIDSWSFEFGALLGHTTEFLFLDNPLWRRPIPKIGPETYYLAGHRHICQFRNGDA